jgi:predicted RNA-binding Zn ribbon-like protein
MAEQYPGLLTVKHGLLVSMAFGMGDVRRSGCESPLEPGGRSPAPDRLALVQRFINTWNCEFPVYEDRLGTPLSALEWLHQSNLGCDLVEADRLGPADLARMRDVREALRSLARANVAGSCDPTSLRVIRSAAALRPMIVAINDHGQTYLEANVSDVNGAVATLIAIVHEAQLTGRWGRLKGCRECGYAFFDRSKNRSATWCSMSICGNRVKNRALYRRKHTPGQPGETLPPEPQA